MQQHGSYFQAKGIHNKKELHENRTAEDVESGGHLSDVGVGASDVRMATNIVGLIYRMGGECGATVLVNTRPAPESQQGRVAISASHRSQGVTRLSSEA